MVTHIEAVTNKGKVIVDEDLNYWTCAFVSRAEMPGVNQNAFNNLRIEGHEDPGGTLIQAETVANMPMGGGELQIDITYKLTLRGNNSTQLVLPAGSEVAFLRHDDGRGVINIKHRIGRRRAPATLVVSNRSE